MFIKLDDVENMKLSKLENLYVKHYNSAFYELLKMNNANIHFSSAQGINLWDNNGNKYMDFLGGFGSLNLGHNNHRVIEALKKHFYEPNFLQQSINIYNGVLANDISFLTHGKLSVCSMTNSGTETVEEAIKLAYMYKKGGNIIYCSNAYHGKTLGSISALGNKYKKNFPNFDKIFIKVPFGDVKALSRAIKKNNAAAFLVEPIQAEGGIVVPPQDYFKKVRALCDEHDVLLIMDEIQTGIGRCGTMFCYEQFGIVPDIMCLSKSLSGGIIPLGCMAVKENIWNKVYGKLKNATLPDSTFGGNNLASVAAIESLTIVYEEKLYENAERLGMYALKKLNDLKKKHDIITDVRGRGLLIGIEFGGLEKLRVEAVIKFMMSTIISKMLNEHKIICGFTGNTPGVLRFEPPLIVKREEIDYFVDSLDKVLSEESSNMRLLIDSAKNISSGLVSK